MPAHTTGSEMTQPLFNLVQGREKIAEEQQARVAGQMPLRWETIGLRHFAVQRQSHAQKGWPPITGRKSAAEERHPFPSAYQQRRYGQQKDSGSSDLAYLCLG